MSAALVLLLAAGLSCCAQTEEKPAAEAESSAPLPAKETPVPLPTGNPEETEERSAPEYPVSITELMPHNKAVLADSDMHFHDWIELCNTGEESLDLKNWRLSDREGKSGWRFPSVRLKPGEYLVVFAEKEADCGEKLLADFSLSDGETVFLFDAEDRLISQFVCPELDDNVSAVRGEEEAAACLWPTPGYENTEAGYCARQEELVCTGPLAIGELTVSVQNGQDWVEIRNISDKTVSLGDYYLSDSPGDYQKWRFPAKWKLRPGECTVLICDPKSENAERIHFSLGISGDELYLFGPDGLIDYLPIVGVPLGGSVGRMDGEAGFFYFSEPSRGKTNSGGERLISQRPACETAEGVYNGVDGVTVVLSGEGDLYYTTDCTRPGADSMRYTEPITITETTVIRAAAKQEGKLFSEPVTCSFILNEDDTLPVISLVGDKPRELLSLTRNMNKSIELPCTLAYFSGDDGFSINCGASLSGNKSLSLPKRSLNIHFRERYGAKTLNYDLFDAGIDAYSSLTIRAGHDYQYLFFRNELWQDLCFEVTDSVLSQHSIYCALYLNGEYNGVYALKENMSRSLFAARYGVDKDSVESQKLPSNRYTSFYKEVCSYCMLKDLSKQENYEHICTLIDVDSFVDYFLVEGFSGNSDLFSNVRLFRSPENGIGWRFALFDLDLSLSGADFAFYNILNISGNNQLRSVYRSLLKNDAFRQKLLDRFSELYGGVLSNQSLLDRFDSYISLLEPALPRDRERWSISMHTWYGAISEYQTLIEKKDWQAMALKNFRRILALDADTMAEAFGVVN